MKKYLPHLCVLAAGVLWGLIGLFNRRLTGAGLSVGSIVLVRNFGALVGALGPYAHKFAAVLARIARENPNVTMEFEG